MSGGARTVVGVDIGGTFTDLFVLDEADGTCRTAKVPSSRPDPAPAVLAGLAAAGAAPDMLATIVHGTTVGTNALLERTGARTGVITTAGFRDVLEMRRRDRPRTWGLRGGYEPVIPRDLRLEVGERTLADGTVREAVDPDEVAARGRDLLARGVEAVCIVFINAYANPANEEAALAALEAVWPNPHLTASSRILPEIREFERTSTASLNAYLQPVVGNYLADLEERLAGDGFAGSLLIVQSNGGVMSTDSARRLPVRTALSGPAAGVIACAHIARSAGLEDVVTCDMGGTSFDVALVAGGESALASQTAVDFGLVIRTPMIEMTTIGAGGGSIARVDGGGLLQVGPESAGSDPGPACYGRGNTSATVTDANLVLGRINPDRPIGGMSDRLDRQAAEAAIMHSVGEPLGLDLQPAAEAVVRVANARMAGAIRLVSIERGHDPGRFTAMPFGGGGALHAGALIREVGLRGALIPRFPGVTSALGCTIADMRHDFVQTLNGMLDDLDEDDLSDRMSGMAREGHALLDAAGVAFLGRTQRFELDMSYLGQTHTVAVALPAHEAGPDGAVSRLTRDDVREAFEARYRDLYGRLLDGLAIRVLNLRGAIIGLRPKLDLAGLAPTAGDSERTRSGTRPVWVAGGWRDAAVFERLALPVGARLDGPALLEQPDATIFVDPGLVATVDRFGNLRLERAEAKGR